MFKKMLLAIASLTLALMCAACGKTDGDLSPDIWDGTVASEFSCGDGSEASPYEIADCAQLAYLAQQINNGADYTDAYFSLTANLDLNNIEWTPIGNGTYPFTGNFNGNGHTVFNLKISAVARYEHTVSDNTYDYSTAGLFGICRDAGVTNLCIDGAEIVTNHAGKVYWTDVGVLAGSFETYTVGEISNIRISNSSIYASASSEAGHSSILSCGGAVGKISCVNDAECHVKNIQSEVTIDASARISKYNYIGGIVGDIGTALNTRSFSVSNLASYLTVQLPKERDISYTGAIGCLSTGNGGFKLDGVYSRVNSNQPRVADEGYFYYNITNAAVGYIYTADGLCEFNNVYGCVSQSDSASEFSNLYFDLFTFNIDVDYTETNCVGCETLPQNHGLDTEVWNLTDMSHPELK